MQHLLTRVPGVDVNIQDRQGYTPFFSGLRALDISSRQTRQLFEQLADSSADLNKGLQHDGETPLQFVVDVIGSSRSAVDQMARSVSGNNSNGSSIASRSGSSASRGASRQTCSKMTVEHLKLCIHMGCDVNKITNRKRNPPLTIAVVCGDLAVVQVLLLAKANPLGVRKVKGSKTPLECVTKELARNSYWTSGNDPAALLEICDLLVGCVFFSDDVSTNIGTNIPGTVWNNDLLDEEDMLSTLLHQVLALHRKGAVLSQHAVETSQELVHTLLDARADLQKRNALGHTAVQVASNISNRMFAQMLQEAEKALAKESQARESAAMMLPANDDVQLVESDEESSLMKSIGAMQSVLHERVVTVVRVPFGLTGEVVDVGLSAELKTLMFPYADSPEDLERGKALSLSFAERRELVKKDWSDGLASNFRDGRFAPRKSTAKNEAGTSSSVNVESEPRHSTNVRHTDVVSAKRAVVPRLLFAAADEEKRQFARLAWASRFGVAHDLKWLSLFVECADLQFAVAASPNIPVLQTAQLEREYVECCKGMGKEPVVEVPLGYESL